MSNVSTCPACNAAPLRLHASGCSHAEEAEAAYLRQGFEVALKTDFVDLGAVRAHAQHILDTCDGGRLMLERFRHQIERADRAERALKNTRDFYELRMNALQKYQKELPEPHRTIICNILANGTPKP